MRPTDHERGLCGISEAPCKQCDNGNGPLAGLGLTYAEHVEMARPGPDCGMGGDTFVDADRCPCGCALEWRDDGFGWLCPHCDEVPW